MSPQVQQVTSRLERTWSQWWLFSLWSGLALGASVIFGTLGTFVLADALLRLPQGGLALLFVVWAAVTIGVIAVVMARSLKSRRSLEATARRIELEFPEIGSNLINLVQLSETNGRGADPFREAAARQSAAAVADVPFETAASRESRWRRFLLCMQTPRDLAESGTALAVILIAGLVLHTLIPACHSATRRLLHPWEFVPSVGSVQITNVNPGDTDVLLGSALEISAQVANPAHKAYPATLYVRQGNSGPETAVPLIADATHEKFVAALPQIVRPLQYRLQIGDSQTPRYTVGVHEKPTVTSVSVAYDYPPYIGKPRDSFDQKQADLEGPQYTRAELRIHPSTTITQGHVMADGQKILGVVRDEGKTLLVEMLLKENSTFTIHMFTEGGHTDPEPRVNQVKVVPDEPPTVMLVEPPRESSAAVGGKASVVVRAGDDHGLGQVRLELTTGEKEGAKPGEPQGVASWDTFADPTSAILHHELLLDAKKFKPGQTLLIRGVARDRRALVIPGVKVEPQETASAWHQIRLIAPEAKSADELAQLDSMRAALAKILMDQIRARVVSGGLLHPTTEPETERLAGEVRAAQVSIQKASVAVLDTLKKTEDKERQVIKNALNKLAFGEMLQAVQEAEAVAKVKALADLAAPATKLAGTQDRIIDVLRRMLNEIRAETADLMAEMKKRPDTELPADAKDKLRALKDKLDEFLKQQKKVIEATEDLAKKPVEDFTEKEKQLMKELAGAEDDWSKFMADKHTDMSKVPEQDLANPSLLKELVEVQTELAMAKDALTKKTADIAVPLEQLGAEMAKEMTTNIEKWLPDTPDREKWSQEEPLTGDMKEAPLAELPKELEDIVGKLMEEEEDLFEEMEDVTSSWADSLDKGAGWDAADGPISNNSARGVTGNRLPNTSEIKGRSGEGRQGKASGEFVGDTAVGKGGRKTPSRLTDDPYVKGQIKDFSKDPVGGATGGGKESGEGGEGLHGPVPNRPPRDMHRLANKQASLRNKAEGVDLKFKVMKYHHNDLNKILDHMGAIEQDLRSGQYRNALRRRDVLLENIGQVKTYVKGEFLVRQDQSANLPTDIQKEILGSMQELSPAGWEELNRQYFERLAQAKGSTAPTPGTPTPTPDSKPAPARSSPEATKP